MILKKQNSLLAFFILLTLVVRCQTSGTHTTSLANISNNSSFLTTEGLDKNPQAIVTIEMDPKSVNPHPVGVWYNGSQWGVFNQDMAPMPSGITFKVSWINPGAGGFYQKSSTSNLRNGWLVIDHPALNNNPNAHFQTTQVWNPEGRGGVYNNSLVVTTYDKAGARWMIQNSNGTPVPAGASFNIQMANTDLSNAQTSAGAATVMTAVILPVPAAATTNNSALSGATTPGPVPPATAVNLGFEKGLADWTATGNAFSNQPIEGKTILSDRVLKNMAYSNGGIGGDYWKGIPCGIGVQGTHWIGSFENGNGDEPTGTLTSSAFLAAARYLHFLLGGGKDINRLYVELQVKKTDYEIAWGAGKKGFWGDTQDGFTRVNRISNLLNADDLYRYFFDLDAELNHQFLNKTIRVMIMDDKSAPGGHINVDDFGFAKDLAGFIHIIKDGFGLYADQDKPIWGFADIHAHWANHIGLKGLLHGSPGGNWTTTSIKNDIPPCDGFNHGLGSITPGLLIAQTEKAAFNSLKERLFGDIGNLTCGGLNIPGILAALPLSASFAGAGSLDAGIVNALLINAPNPAFQACGYQTTKDVFAKHYNNAIPDAAPGYFVDFPKWNTFFHQTMHITWVHRSYEGGQRLMVVHVGTARSWEFNSLAGEPTPPARQHIEEAVNYMKSMVAQNPDWLEIAYTPQDARRIILSNKMAIVLGIEQAEIGSYFNNIEEEINWLAGLGIRHFFPIHNIDNTLGGAAIFNSTLNSYNDLVNRQSQTDPIQAFHVRNGYTAPSVADNTYTNMFMKTNFMRQAMRNFPIAGFGNIPFFYSNDIPAEYGYNGYTGHKNATGLTTRGRQYILSLMSRGMVIDLDHMSDLAQDQTVEMMNAIHYPMVSGHSNLRDLRRGPNDQSNHDQEAKLRTEFTIPAKRAVDITKSAGMFGLMSQQNDIKDAPGCPVANNNAGGTPSFIQAYWYLLSTTGGNKGIAFGTDFNGFSVQVSPRFGVDAGYFLEGDDTRNVAIGAAPEDKLRRQQAFAQVRGVKYDTPVNTWHYHRFPKPAFLTSEERDVWEAIAIAKSGTDIEHAWQPGGGGLFGLTDPARTIIQINKIKNLAFGFRMAVEEISRLDCPEYILKGDCPAERRAAFMAVHGENSIRADWRDARTMELYRVITPIYNLWMQFENGPNEPLRRSFAFAGGRDFDFNIDGLAHYGMLPDMVQDMKNLGLTPPQLQPLFMAAEEYIRVWENAVLAGEKAGK